MPLKFGKKPPVHTARTMRSALALARHLDPLGSPPTASNPYYQAVENAVGGPDKWGMMLNDQLGDCLAEGTVVDSTTAISAYRAPYDGPMVTISTASGNRLSVTPNHAVLTPRGFVRAKTLKKGDDLVSASGTQPFPWPSLFGRKGNVDNPPARVEQVFAAAAFRFGSIRKIMPVSVDFHGDATFFHGDVDIIGADRFLRRKLYATLREPHGQNEVSAARQLQGTLVGAGAAFLRSLRARFAAHGDICFGGQGSPLAYAHAGVSQSDRLGQRTEIISGFQYSSFKLSRRHSEASSDIEKRLAGDIGGYGFGHVPPMSSRRDRFLRPLRSDLKASRSQPSADGVPTDPDLFRDILHAVPGIVASDRVIDVDVNGYHGFVYDLSVGPRWHIANGIVTHNCTCADTAHHLMLRTANVGQVVVPTDADVERMYEAFGFRPGDSSSDQGANETDVCRWDQQVGLLGHRCVNYGSLDPRNLDHLRWGVQLFGAVRLGIQVPDDMEDQFSAGQVLARHHGSQLTEDGHDVPIVHYEGDRVWIVTWGRRVETSWDWLRWCMDEAHAELYPDWIRAQGTAPNNFTLDQLVADLAHVGGGP